MLFFPGQCTDYKLQTNQYKRSSGYQLGRTDVAISDNFLSEEWYQFQSAAGNDMVTSSPSIAMCGTIYPVWLNGKAMMIYRFEVFQCLYLKLRITLNVS